MENRKEATKQKIFEVSLRLFTQKGYGSTSIRDIAQAANVSTGLLFHYFPNKQALLASHLELAASGMASAVELLGAKRPPIDVFFSIAKLTLESLKEPIPRYLYLLMNQPLSPAAVSGTLRQRIKKDHIILASVPVIEEGQKLSAIKSGNPYALAVAFWSAIQGVAEILAEQPNAPIPDPDWLVDILRA